MELIIRFILNLGDSLMSAAQNLFDVVSNLGDHLEGLADTIAKIFG